MKLRQRLRQGVEAHAALAPAVSSKSTALSGSWRPVDSGATGARRSEWRCPAYARRVLCITGLQSPQHQTGGVIIRSSTLTIWKRRSSAASRSKYVCIRSTWSPRWCAVRPLPVPFQQVRRIRAASLVTRADNGRASSINSSTGSGDFCAASITFSVAAQIHL